MPYGYPYMPIDMLHSYPDKWDPITALLGENPEVLCDREGLYGIYLADDEAALHVALDAYLTHPDNKDHSPPLIDIAFVGPAVGQRVTVQTPGPRCDRTCRACRDEVSGIRQEMRHDPLEYDPLEMVCEYLSALEPLLQKARLDTGSLPPLPSKAAVDLVRSAGSLGD